MHTRKIFVGVNIAPSAAKLIGRKLRDFDDLPIRWSKSESWRLVLSFAGHWDNEALPEFLAKIEAAAQTIEAHDIVFDKITIAPDEARPKMVWLTTTEPQSAYANLRTAIDRVLAPLTPAHAPGYPHITLGRIRQAAWRELSLVPTINRAVSIVVPVDAVTIWESTTIDGANAYVPLAEYPLK